MNREQRAERLRPLFRRLVAESSLRAVASRAGVSHGTLHNLVEKGWAPYTGTLDRLEAWARAEGHGIEEQAPASDQHAAEQMLEHFEGVIRRMDGAGIAPEELYLRKLDVLEGLKRLYAAAGGVPSWVYELEGKVRREETERAELSAGETEEARRVAAAAEALQAARRAERDVRTGRDGPDDSPAPRAKSRPHQ